MKCLKSLLTDIEFRLNYYNDLMSHMSGDIIKFENKTYTKEYLKGQIEALKPISKRLEEILNLE